MNERERADWLARTVDNILRGSRPAAPPDGLDERDVDGLLRAASTRMSEGSKSARSALQYEGAVWREVLQRLDRRQRPRQNATPNSEPAHDKRQRNQATEKHLDDRGAITSLRRTMTGDLPSGSITHGTGSGKGRQATVDDQPKKRGLFWFLRRSDRDADRLEPAIDAIAFGKTLEIGPEDDGLISTARTRKGFTHFFSRAADERRDHIWSQVQTRVERQGQRDSNRSTARTHSRRWVFGAAAASIVVAAIALLPVTGLANHPVAEAARFVGNYIGVTETVSAPPAPTSDFTIVSATQVSATEASETLGITVADAVPLTNFDLTSSRYFSEPITSDHGGTYVLTYQGRDPAQSLVIYQELASEVNLAIGSEASAGVSLSDGTSTTYVEGVWDVTGPDDLSWNIGRTQTLIFERDGLRTIIRYTGPTIEASILTEIANLLG